MDSGNFILKEADLRKLVRLLAATALVKGGRQERKCYLLNGLCRMVRAEAWDWKLVRNHGEKGAVVTDWLQANSSNENGLLSGKNAGIRENFSEVDGREMALSSGKNSGSGGALIAGPLYAKSTVLESADFSTIRIYRRKGEPPFSQREADMLEVIFSELPWLHEAAEKKTSSDKVPKLASRQKICLTLMGAGRSRKEIALAMKISINTVAGYAREIYRSYEVRSQSELMRKLK